MLDKDKGGYFTISPKKQQNLTTKQQYLPSSNILQTRYLHEDGVLNLVDFFPRPNSKIVAAQIRNEKVAGAKWNAIPERATLKKWLVRRVECIRGAVDVDLEVFPAFSEPNTSEVLKPLC